MLVRLSLDRAVWAEALARDNMLMCSSKARHFTLTVPLSLHVYKSLNGYRRI